MGEEVGVTLFCQLGDVVPCEWQVDVAAHDCSRRSYEDQLPRRQAAGHCQRCGWFCKQLWNGTKFSLLKMLFVNANNLEVPSFYVSSDLKVELINDQKNLVFCIIRTIRKRNFSRLSCFLLGSPREFVSCPNVWMVPCFNISGSTRLVSSARTDLKRDSEWFWCIWQMENKMNKNNMNWWPLNMSGRFLDSSRF